MVTSLGEVAAKAAKSVIEQTAESAAMRVGVDARSTVIERLALLIKGIRESNQRVLTMMKDGQEPIVFLGATGSGKSTLINVLAGCAMQRVDTDELGVVSIEEEVVVVSEQSPVQARAEIGHTKVSQTRIAEFIPTISGDICCDCPGFFDTRNVEANIINSAHIREIMRASKTVRVVILLEHSALDTNKSRSVFKVVDIVRKMFRSAESFRQNKASVALGITKVPHTHQKQKPLAKVKQVLLKAASRFEQDQKEIVFDTEIVRAFVDNLFIYDPEDRVDKLRYSGGLTRDELLKYLHEMPRMKNTHETIRMALTAEDESALNRVKGQLLELITSTLEQKEYKDLFIILNYIEPLRKWEHASLEAIVQSCEDEVIKYLKATSQLVDEELIKDTTALTETAQTAFQTVQQLLGSFEEEKREKLLQAAGVADLEMRINERHKRINFNKRKNALKRKEDLVNIHHIRGDFNLAAQLLEELKEDIIRFKEEFEGLEDLEIDTDGLGQLLQQRRSEVEQVQRRINYFNRRAARRKWCRDNCIIL